MFYVIASVLPPGSTATFVSTQGLSVCYFICKEQPKLLQLNKYRTGGVSDIVFMKNLTIMAVTFNVFKKKIKGEQKLW